MMSNKDLNIDWDLMGKYLSDEANHFEKKKFEEAIKNDEAYEKVYVEAKDACDQALYALQFQQIDGESAFVNVMAAIQAPTTKRRFKITPKVLAVAATFFALIAISTIVFFIVPRHSDGKMVNLFFENGSENLVLADGSQVNINKLSSISYPSVFVADTRLINFEGEGFFRVKSDSLKPFVVLVGNLKVKVLGTAFNIKAYPNDNSMEVVVEHGKVEVSFGEQVVTLVKGEKAVADKQVGALKKLENTDVNYSAWNTKKIVFAETPLLDVANTLELVYGVEVVINDTSLLSNRLTANFHRTDLDAIFKVICRTFNCDYQMDGGKYVIVKKSVN